MSMVDQYVKATYLLQGIENGPAAIDALVDMTEVSPASANKMIGKSESRDLAEHEKYKGVTLTDDGIVRVRDASRTYYIIKHFLSNVLDVEELRAEVRGLEPVTDRMIAERLDAIIDRNLGYPDCFGPETDACEYLDACGAGPGTKTEAAD